MTAARADPEDHSRFAQSGEGDDRAHRDRGRGAVATELGGACTLPIAAEIDRWPAAHRQTDNTVRLLAVADAAEVLAPGCLLGIAEEIRPSDVVVMPEFAAAQTGEVGFYAIGAGAFDAVAVLMVDPPHGEPGVQLVPGRALVGVNQGALVDPLSDRRHGGLLRRAHLRQRPAVALAHHHDHLTLARLVLGEPPVDPIGSHVFRPDVATKVGAVDLRNSSLTAET